MSQGYGPPPPGGGYGPPPPGGGYGPPPPGGGYGPPPPGGGYGQWPHPQPPRTSYAVVWTIIAVAVVVLAGGGIGAYFLLSGGDSGSSSHGTTSVAYVNACDVLQPAQVRTLIPQVTSTQVKVDETYSEKPSVTVDSTVETVQSTCEVAPLGDDSSKPSTQLSIGIATDPRYMPGVDEFTGDPVSGVPDARAQSASDRTIVEWIHGSDVLTLSVETAVPTAQIPTMISTLNQRVDQHPAAVQPLAPVQQVDGTATVDACTMLTADDFKNALGTPPDPAQVERDYQLPAGVPNDGTIWATCKRQALAGSGGEKTATVEMAYFTSSADARSFATSEGGNPVSGIGDEAWLDSSTGTLNVIRGNYFLSFQCSGGDDNLKKLASTIVAKVD